MLFRLTEPDVERLLPILAWVDTQWRTQQYAYPDDSPGNTQSLREKLSDDGFRKLLVDALKDDTWDLDLPDFDEIIT